ncbi:hypothetical protein C7H84_09555 [Burkholderia sp. Nafp2/4-1b]|uniref:hypothetical protein n=1 Tax=Burkholderia sp. Nafp2/4-1b TaxID=2116686 RepID=UPI000EF8E83C|nr:hypothetical protein [Burkholderia sp. Nafp2/4-1b]RKU03374.1 hypothetical protein C7H84_09555 [Burkholderia sp. Nafp2/4-1b]
MNTVIETKNGLEIGRVRLTSLQIHHCPDGVTSIVMTDGENVLRMFATPDQVAHVIRLLDRTSAVA